MKFKKIYITMIAILLISAGCSDSDSETKSTDKTEEHYAELMNYVEALELFEEGMEAEVLDIETGITYTVRRIEGGYTTIADVETVSIEDTEALLETAGGEWNIIRRAVIVTIGDYTLAASISPYEHSGSEDYDFLEIIDNRTGATGTGVNLDYIRDNGMIGVVDIYFYNSLIPGYNRIDERHQEMVLEAYEYEFEG